jgi:hypothetical protein
VRPHAAWRANSVGVSLFARRAKCETDLGVFLPQRAPVPAKACRIVPLGDPIHVPDDLAPVEDRQVVLVEEYAELLDV